MRREDHSAFALAGLWTERELAGEQLRSCAVLTTEADAELGRFHERMPIVLSVEQVERWLDPTCPMDQLAMLWGSSPRLEVA